MWNVRSLYSREVGAFAKAYADSAQAPDRQHGFTCAVMQSMLQDYAEWNDRKDIYDIAAPQLRITRHNTMDARAVDLRQGPAGRS